MRLDLPRLKERFGAVLFYGMQDVFELDAGLAADESPVGGDAAIQRVPYEDLHAALNDMVIVVPVREEKLKLLDGVLTGIPSAAQIIVVSNSSRTPVDRFELERNLISTFSAYVNRPIICVHQKDPQLAKAFQASGYTELLGDDGLIRSGKAEGMMLGTVLAKLTGRRTIGFIDSDNYFPGAVLEYCHLYAAAFAMARKMDYAMVRISWNSKPKVVENNLYFAKWGRSSIITNRYLNQLVSAYTGFETEAIRTGNAGEHAMTIDLAMSLGFSAGYSIEPYQLVYLMEEYGGMSEPTMRDALQKHIHVYQVESRNPHLHEYKGEEHVERMIEASLSVIYHSRLCPPSLKERIRQELHKRDIRPEEQDIPALNKYVPLVKANLDAFFDVVKNEAYGDLLKRPPLRAITPIKTTS